MESSTKWLNDLVSPFEIPSNLRFNFDQPKPVRVESESHQLGRYFEDCVEAKLRADSRISKVLRGLQIKSEDGSTLGEFDFLYLREDQWFHLEVALKIYLLWNSKWLGPDPRDELEQKWNLILDKQSQLSRHPLAREFLSQNGVESPIPRVFFAAWLFTENGEAPGGGVNPGSVRGRWIRASDASSYVNWLEIRKSAWGMNSIDKVEAWKSEKPLRGRRPVMLIPPTGESDRVLCLPNDWPH